MNNLYQVCSNKYEKFCSLKSINWNITQEISFYFVTIETMSESMRINVGLNWIWNKSTKTYIPNHHHKTIHFNSSFLNNQINNSFKFILDISKNTKIHGII